MDDILLMIGTGFSFFVDHELFEIPLLYWFIGISVLGLVISFLKGKGGNGSD